MRFTSYRFRRKPNYVDFAARDGYCECVGQTDKEDAVRAEHFAPTQWSLILHAGGQSPGCRQALDSLCRTYWYPLYAHVRRSGFDRDSAQDLTQGFFADILSRNDLATLDRGRGRFRSWLLACLNH